MTDTPIKRASKAIQSFDGTMSRLSAEAIVEIVLSELREPSELMCCVGESVEIQVDFDEPGRNVGGAAIEVWRAMIDTALKETGE